MRGGVWTVMLLLGAASAWAQPREPLPVIVVDLRGFYAALGQDPVTAGDLLVTPGDLPGRGLGAAGGVQLYPVRGRTISLGIGAEAILARGRNAPAPDEDDDDVPEEDGEVVAPLPPINQRLIGWSGNLSLNFGSRNGWSYVTAGMGPMRFGTFEGDQSPPRPAPVKMTINYGGGARWFAWRHVAFAVDVRFYQTRPESRTQFYAGRARSSLRILSAGISIR
jgi:hypothetical protein